MRIDTYTATRQNWPLAQPFRIARGAKTEATIIQVELRAGQHIGRGECCPYPRYGETVDQILGALNEFDLNAIAAADARTLRTALLEKLPSGSARNALDCALWDLEAKQTAKPVWQLAGLEPPQPRVTCYTLSLDTPEAMAKNATEHAECPLLKLKLGDPADDAARMAAVRTARPGARLVADANEGWNSEILPSMIAAAEHAGLELIEQPLPADSDGPLTNFKATSIPICADEAAAPGKHISTLADRYQAINIKLDKTGGLTHALELISEARNRGFQIMIGSIVSTSLAMAPAALLGGLADWIDLDSPLLLAQDRPAAMTITQGRLSTPHRDLWG